MSERIYQVEMFAAETGEVLRPTIVCCDPDEAVATARRLVQKLQPPLDWKVRRLRRMNLTPRGVGR